ncbi:restriction endonuclease subunit S [Phascolarctobacterium faecium]|uniref:restriction endonuclease subunit S n=1 Tax=Phascolarctobacterium faecium TaxID=33025 RepID=UPI00399A971A
MARLGDICIQITDGSHNPPMGVEQSNYLMLSSKNIDDDYITLNDPRYLSQEDFEAENRRTNIKPNDLLITIVGTIGRVAIVPNSLTEFCVQRSVAVLKPKPEIVYNRFLMHYLQSMRPYLEQESRGVAQKGIYLKQLSNLSIILPPLDEQRKIAAVLDKVSDLIAKRRQQLDKLDEIVKSRFIEMFGVYPANPMGWEIGTIRDIVTEVRYGSSRPAVDGGKYPYLRMNNITYGGELDLSDTKRIDIPDNELDKCTVRRGDVLFNRTNSKELVGKTCVYDRDEMMVLAGFVIRIRVKDCILPEFLSAFLNTDFSKQMLLGMCKTAIGQANINAQELQNIGLYLPPVELQRRFIQFKKETDKSKLAIQKSLEKLEILKKSLMQKYFG